MWKWAPAAALLLLVGCQTMTPEERLASDRETCRGYGFKKQNDAFAECMQRLDLDRRQARRYNQATLDEWERDLRLRRPPYYY